MKRCLESPGENPPPPGDWISVLNETITCLVVVGTSIRYWTGEVPGPKPPMTPIRGCPNPSPTTRSRPNPRFLKTAATLVAWAGQSDCARCTTTSLACANVAP